MKMVEVSITECRYKIGDKHLDYNKLEYDPVTYRMTEDEWMDKFLDLAHSSNRFEYWGFDEYRGTEVYIEYIDDECETEYWYDVKEI